MTNAERQARWREKREAELETLRKRVAKLEAENTKLKAVMSAAQQEPAAEQARTPKPLYTPPPGGTDRKRPTYYDEQQQINTLRALWKSGRDKYVSFFAVLDEVRQENGDDAMDEWCRSKLGISLGYIIKASSVLNNADKAIKQSFAAAIKKASR